jgi:hypothetical protein
MPAVPQVRMLTEWTDVPTGKGIVFNFATSTELAFASSTNDLLYSSTTATSTFASNAEYLYIKSLFASSTELQDALDAQKKPAVKKPFVFKGATSTVGAQIATSTKSWRDFIVFEQNDDVFISWKGNKNDVPYYYCVNYENESKTISQYGQHIYSSLLASVASSSDLVKKEGERICRDTIRIDRLNKKVAWFDFFPDSTDLILMQLEDGLYVVEVDDRAWQNTQLLYPGRDLQVIQDGGRIFVHDGPYYLEVFTELSSQQ